jgi:LIVCS family branched-chain amino acid:cation transporter
MKDSTIKNIGNYTFWICFLLGNVCLFGSIITKKADFIIGGYVLIFFASAVNLLIILGLLMYGLLHRNQLQSCFYASKILCINIPIAVLYTVLGIKFNTI